MKAELEPHGEGRVLGEYTRGAPGPLFLLTGGLHGNEPAGVHAARRVLDALAVHRPPLRGEVAALAGNLVALRRGVRYVERDLNRAWGEEDLARLRDPAAPRYGGERGELQGLLGELEGRLGRDPDGVVLLDLHSTSAAGAPFAITRDTPRNRPLAFSLGVPVLLGLEELVEGTLLSFLGSRGHVAMVVEGGRHDAPSTVDHLEAAVWLALVGAGSLRAGDAPVPLGAMRRRLAESARGLPRAVEIRHRHRLHPGEEFRMEPGLANFQRVRKGQVLAHAGPGGTRPVPCPLDGLLLLPRYQGQGEDGFFVGREVALACREDRVRRRAGKEKGG